jgi:hypothetical protein
MSLYLVLGLIAVGATSSWLLLDVYVFAVTD